jgi:hypothetical protein
MCSSGEKLDRAVEGVEEGDAIAFCRDHCRVFHTIGNQDRRLAQALHAHAPLLPGFEEGKRLADGLIDGFFQRPVAMHVVTDAGSGADHQVGSDLILHLRR